MDTVTSRRRKNKYVRLNGRLEVMLSWVGVGSPNQCGECSSTSVYEHHVRNTTTNGTVRVKKTQIGYACLGCGKHYEEYGRVKKPGERDPENLAAMWDLTQSALEDQKAKNGSQ
tara:strand:- start:98 stop:439 length:342 start_codon:yes stop_codon:yes gene_type:complete